MSYLLKSRCLLGYDALKIEAVRSSETLIPWRHIAQETSIWYSMSLETWDIATWPTVLYSECYVPCTHCVHWSAVSLV